MLPIICDCDKTQEINDEVKKSSLSVEAKSIINELLAKDLDEWISMMPQPEESVCYGCGKTFPTKSLTTKNIYEGTDFRPEPGDFIKVKVCNQCN
jgi:hypothetical protein